ncbi:hypothetical protein [Stenotrophomonas sp. Iso1]|uniref:hypothetical protein n=1 Tax=Stenotrophomonas sp. Iso1 TaxID=2977283 RepID=UPI0022B7A311|nr:hypothetical protein [Stenotrophomonas sp. Iso1]
MIEIEDPNQPSLITDSGCSMGSALACASVRERANVTVNYCNNHGATKALAVEREPWRSAAN